MAGTIVADLSVASTFSITLLVGALVLIVVVACSRLRASEDSDKAGDKSRQSKSNKAQSSSKDKSQQQPSKGKKKLAVTERRNRQNQSVFVHPWSLGSLKGHQTAVLDLDFSNNGKYMASCAEDRTVLIWMTKYFTAKEHKCIRTNTEYDHATQVKWSPDSKAFLIAQANGNTVQVYKLGKKDDGTVGNIQPVLTFPTKHSKDILKIGVACNGKFIMTCTAGTTIYLWDLKGNRLASIDNHQMQTNHACISPCGRFVASCGFTSDVKVWEVRFNKTGEFQDVVRAFELTGHTAAVYGLNFNNDSSRIASVSRDGTWRMWNINVDYSKGEEVQMLLKISFPHSGPSLVALSPDARTVAVASGDAILVYNALNGQECGKIEGAHSDTIKVLTFDSENKYLVSAGDKNIRIFHNVVGYRVTIQDLEEKKKKASGPSVKERIHQQIKSAKAALKLIVGDQQ